VRMHFFSVGWAGEARQGQAQGYGEVGVAGWKGELHYRRRHLARVGGVGLLHGHVGRFARHSLSMELQWRETARPPERALAP